MYSTLQMLQCCAGLLMHASQPHLMHCKNAMTAAVFPSPPSSARMAAESLSHSRRMKLTACRHPKAP